MFGICLWVGKNHGFMDGNKRSAYLTVERFLKLNKFKLIATEAEIFNILTSVANNEITQDELAEWFRDIII